MMKPKKRAWYVSFIIHGETVYLDAFIAVSWLITCNLSTQSSDRHWSSFPRFSRRLSTSSKKWTMMTTGRSQKLKFWKIKKHSWTVKWQTMADSYMYHMMNCSKTVCFCTYSHLFPWRWIQAWYIRKSGCVKGATVVFQHIWLKSETQEV